MQQELNILEILKKIPNLEDMVFYCPLYGDVKVSIDDGNYYSIELYNPEGICNSNYLNGLVKEGYFEKTSFGKREIMLYPSRQNRDWSTLKIPRKDLPEGTNVMVSDYPGNGWVLRKYVSTGKCYNVCDHISRLYIPWKYIIPIDKFNFEDWSFNNEDNYGTDYKG